MQGLNWNDLRYLLAVARSGSLNAAAARLGVDQTTVARRLRAAEAALGARLFERTASGALHPTQAGEAAIARAERAEWEIEGLRTVGDSNAEASGVVRVTAVPMLVNHLLLPAVAELSADHPGLRVELVAEPRNLSLVRREADIALRLARPEASAGKSMLAWRIGSLAYGVYVPSGCAPAAEAALPWITYEEGMAELPQARWIAAAMAGNAASSAAVAVNDAEGVLQAIRSGLGRSLLPAVVGDHAPGVRAIAGTPQPFVLTREIWLLTHPDHRPLARVAAVISWLERVIRRCDASLPAVEGGEGR